MSRLTRDGTAEPFSRDQILRHVRGQGNIYFLCSADHDQDWQSYPVDPYSAICDDHTYIHTHTYIRKTRTPNTKKGAIKLPDTGNARTSIRKKNIFGPCFILSQKPLRVGVLIRNVPIRTKKCFHSLFFFFSSESALSTVYTFVLLFPLFIEHDYYN